MMVLVSLKAGLLLLVGLIWHGADYPTRQRPSEGGAYGRGEAGLQQAMGRKYELQKTFDKGRRPRRHLTPKGRKALRHLRVTVLIVVVFFAVLFSWALRNRRETPHQPQNVGAGCPALICHNSSSMLNSG